MKGFWQILKQIVAYSSGISIIGGSYLLVDSIKNKPLTETQVVKIVQQQINPLSEVVFKTYISVVALDSATVRTLRNMPKDKVLMLYYKDLMFTKPLPEVKKDSIIVTPKPIIKHEKIKR
jgi:hypothetical protein